MINGSCTPVGEDPSADEAPPSHGRAGPPPRICEIGSTTQPGFLVALRIRMARVKRSFLIILLVLLLATVVNVAVAWGFALWADPAAVEEPEIGLVITDSDSWEFVRFSRVGFTAFMSTRAVDGRVPPQTHGPDPDRMVPHWVDLGRPSPVFEAAAELHHDGLLVEHRTVIACGFPLRCLWYEPVSTVGNGSRRVLPSQGGYVAIRSKEGLFPRGLPLRPIWLNVAINTLLYAVVLWLLISGPVALRRHIRARRGGCAKCGYPAGASEICTEYGATL